jgi:hypothetical protein
MMCLAGVDRIRAALLPLPPLPPLLLPLLLLLQQRFACALQINRGGIPRQVPRPPEYGGPGPGAGAGGAQPPPPAPARVNSYLVPPENIRVHAHLMDFHRAGQTEYGWQRAVDGDVTTQSWLRSPRSGSHLEVQLIGLAGPVARVEVVEHPTDFCKVCMIPIGQSSKLFNSLPGEDITFSPPVMMDRFRIKVMQTQIVWWQLYEIRVWSTMPVRAAAHGRRNLQEEAAQRPQKVTLLTPNRGQQQQQQQQQQQHAPTPPPPPVIVCVPDCHAKHGKCVPNPHAARDPNARRGVDGRPYGVCVCEEGWLPPLCSQPSCGSCDISRGQCLAPGQCRCYTGWSGPECDTQGEVTYGMALQLGVNRRREQLLQSPVGARLASGHVFRQPVVATELRLRGDPGGVGTGGAAYSWWQLLGPRGTSEGFLRNYTVMDGATVRLRQLGGGGGGGGGWLAGDVAQSAIARRDCKQVSVGTTATGARGGGAEDPVEGGEEAWHVYVDRGAERGRASGRAWGLRSSVMLVHVRSGLVLSSNGNILRQAVGGQGQGQQQFYNLPEVQLQGVVPGSAAQPWTVQAHIPAAVAPEEIAAPPRAAPYAGPAAGLPFNTVGRQRFHLARAVHFD